MHLCEGVRECRRHGIPICTLLVSRGREGLGRLGKPGGGDRWLEGQSRWGASEVGAERVAPSLVGFGEIGACTSFSEEIAEYVLRTRCE